MEYSKSLSINLFALDKAFSILHFMLVEVSNPASVETILYKSFRDNFLFLLWYLININSIKWEVPEAEGLNPNLDKMFLIVSFDDTRVFSWYIFLLPIL